MINSSLKKQNGAATFLITTLLLVSMTLVIIFSASYTMMQQKTNANATRSQQAYEAAEAGLEFGINYLQKNSVIILATKISGFVQPYSDSSTSNVTLANGSKYTITYTNPIANNYNLIKISSTGVNDDGTASRTVSQLVKFGSLLFAPPNVSLTSKAGVTLAGNSTITDTVNSGTVISGSSVSLAGSSQTVTGGGISSTPGHISGDITQNNTKLSNISSADLFESYFGLSMNTVKNNANYTYTDLGNYNSVLNGKTGTTIWIDQTTSTATINGNTVIGSITNPVLLIVNGSFVISGNATIYGFIYVIGGETTDADITGNAKIFGAMVTGGNLDLKGSTTLTYNPTVLSTLQQQIMTYYAKVPGSWRDF